MTLPEVPVGAGEPLHVGENLLLRWWPPAVVLFSLVLAWMGMLGAAALCALLAYVFASLVPWRYAVLPSGILLWFGFGKRRFLGRDVITVACDIGGATVSRRGARRPGYLLPQPLGTIDSTALRAALTECEFEVRRP